MQCHLVRNKVVSTLIDLRSEKKNWVEEEVDDEYESVDKRLVEKEKDRKTKGKWEKTSEDSVRGYTLGNMIYKNSPLRKNKETNSQRTKSNTPLWCETTLSYL